MKAIFSTIFIALLFLPIVFFSAHSTISERENRNLAPKPYLLKENRLNPSYFSESDSYLQDHFGLREPLIKLNQKTADIFNCVFEPKRAIQGKSGWYF